MGCISTMQLNDERRTNGLGGPDTTVGQNNTLSIQSTFARVDAQATIEPDADGDLYGDETQDQCPSDSTTQGPCTANLSITKVAGPEPATVGQDLTYTITATNTSATTTAENVVVSDTLPAGAAFKSSGTSQGSCAGTSTVGCNIGSLGPGGTATVTIVVTPTTPGALSNTATVSSSTPDPNPANNSATATSTVNPAGPGGGGGGDVIAPVVVLRAKSPQDVDKLALFARANEDATVRARAAVSLPGAARIVRSKRARVEVVANRRAKVRLRFGRKALRAIKAAIRSGRRPRARIRVTATDRAGNVTTRRKTVRLKN